MKKDSSYFFVLLKKHDLLFASWKLDSNKWKTKIEKLEQKSKTQQCLFINVYIVNQNKDDTIKIDTIPVHGLENNWHVFIKNDYSGKSVRLTLAHKDSSEEYHKIISSKVINLPLSLENIESAQSSKNKSLYELSQINLTMDSGSDATSSW